MPSALTAYAIIVPWNKLTVENIFAGDVCIPCYHASVEQTEGEECAAEEVNQHLDVKA